MAQQTSPFPSLETRFFRAGGFIYKFEIRRSSCFSGEKVIDRNCFDQELEDIIRTVLGNLDSLQPFSSSQFNVYPYKKRWEGLSKVMYIHNKKRLKPFPFILILDLERKTHSGKQVKMKQSTEEGEIGPRSKRCRRDSPLEEAILNDLIDDMEAESKICMVGRLHVSGPHAEAEVKEDPGHVDKHGSEGLTPGSDKSRVKPGVNATEGSGSPVEVQPGTGQDVADEEGGNRVSERSGILTRLASHIFPFSWFFRDH